MRFSNFRNKHSKDSIFSPVDFMKYRKRIGKYPSFNVPEGVILCFSKSFLKEIIENHKVTKVEGFAGEMYLLKDTKDKIAIIGKFGIGAPVTVSLVEELIAFGIKKFIFVGTAGTLQKKVKIGDIMICEKAIRDEGTSYHYQKKSKYAYAPKEMINKLEESLRKNKKKYFIGTSWTTDAPYRETVAEARKYQKEGVTTVEMEASALFTLAKYRKVEMGGIFVISDSISELIWKPKFHTKRTKSGFTYLFKIIIDALNN